MDMNDKNIEIAYDAYGPVAMGNTDDLHEWLRSHDDEDVQTLKAAVCATQRSDSKTDLMYATIVIAETWRDIMEPHNIVDMFITHKVVHVAN